MTNNEIIKAWDILAKLDFFGGQRAGRELWNEKPVDVQNEDIKNFSKDIAFLKDLINRHEEKNSNLTSDLTSLQNNLTSAKAEIERLKNILMCFMDALGKVRKLDDIDEISLIPLMSELNKQYRAELKTEVYKECIEKVKELLNPDSSFDFRKQLNNLLKEMGVGEKQNANTCISCGSIIPEGRLQCPNCENSVKERERIDSKRIPRADKRARQGHKSKRV